MGIWEWGVDGGGRESDVCADLCLRRADLLSSCFEDDSVCGGAVRRGAVGGEKELATQPHRFVISQVPKGEGPGAPRFMGGITESRCRGTNTGLQAESKYG